ncbi:MAG: hypothetical protein E7589_01700 [Ruminococcaceae bacterium]|nr:hypothetical protein [Oscillospiraceae bacterium]
MCDGFPRTNPTPRWEGFQRERGIEAADPKFELAENLRSTTHPPNLWSILVTSDDTEVTENNNYATFVHRMLMLICYNYAVHAGRSSEFENGENTVSLLTLENKMHTICGVRHFSLDKITRSGQVFRWYAKGNGEFLIYSGQRCITATQSGDCLTVSADKNEFDEYWKHYFALDEDYGSYFNGVTSGNDTYAAECARVSDGIRILNQDLFETMVSFVISQNNNIPRIRGCIERIVAQNGGAFPTADELLSLDLSGCGLGYRESRGYMRAVGAAYSSEFESYIRSLDYNGAKAELLKIKGIGNKVADCICLFALGHKDAFPRDTHINDIIDREYGGVDPSGRWQGYAGIVQQWIFFDELLRTGR